MWGHFEPSQDPWAYACTTPTVSSTTQCHCQSFVVGIRWCVHSQTFQVHFLSATWVDLALFQQSAHSTTGWSPQYSYDTTKCSQSPKIGPSCSIVDILTISNVQGNHLDVWALDASPANRWMTIALACACRCRWAWFQGKWAPGVSTPWPTIHVQPQTRFRDFRKGFFWLTPGIRCHESNPMHAFQTKQGNHFATNTEWFLLKGV